MEREIKFRAWNFPNKTMYQNIQDGILAENEKGQLVIGVTLGKLLKDAGSKIMQYTGLNDKKGIEIYEGDIVKCGYGIGKVVFLAGCFIVEWIDDKESYNEFLFSRKGVYSRIDDDELFEVIGNIFENPELLTTNYND